MTSNPHNVTAADIEMSALPSNPRRDGTTNINVRDDRADGKNRNIAAHNQSSLLGASQVFIPGTSTLINHKPGISNNENDVLEDESAEGTSASSIAANSDDASPPLRSTVKDHGSDPKYIDYLLSLVEGHKWATERPGDGNGQHSQQVTAVDGALGNGHPHEKRKLSDREYAALNGFPNDFPCKNMNQIENAVAPNTERPQTQVYALKQELAQLEKLHKAYKMKAETWSAEEQEMKGLVSRLIAEKDDELDQQRNTIAELTQKLEYAESRRGSDSSEDLTRLRIDKAVLENELKHNREEILRLLTCVSRLEKDLKDAISQRSSSVIDQKETVQLRIDNAVLQSELNRCQKSYAELKDSVGTVMTLLGHKSSPDILPNSFQEASAPVSSRAVANQAFVNAQWHSKDAPRDREVESLRMQLKVSQSTIKDLKESLLSGGGDNAGSELDPHDYDAVQSTQTQQEVLAIKATDTKDKGEENAFEVCEGQFIVGPSEPEQSFDFDIATNTAAPFKNNKSIADIGMFSLEEILNDGDDDDDEDVSPDATAAGVNASFTEPGTVESDATIGEQLKEVAKDTFNDFCFGETPGKIITGVEPTGIQGGSYGFSQDHLNRYPDDIVSYKSNSWDSSEERTRQIQEHQARGFRNWNDDKFPGFFRHGLEFVPCEGHTNYARTVMLGNLPTTTELREVLARVRGGEILHAVLLDTRNITGSMSARIVFQSEIAADEYVFHVTENPITFGQANQVASAILVDTPTYPTKFRGFLDRANKQTRCFKIDDFPADYSIPKLRAVITRGNPHRDNSIVELYLDYNNVAHVEFASHEVARSAFSILTGRSTWGRLLVTWEKDPCSGSLEELKDDLKPRKPTDPRPAFQHYEYSHRDYQEGPPADLMVGMHRSRLASSISTPAEFPNHQNSRQPASAVPSHVPHHNPGIDADGIVADQRVSHISALLQPRLAQPTQVTQSAEGPSHTPSKDNVGLAGSKYFSTTTENIFDSVPERTRHRHVQKFSGRTTDELREAASSISANPIKARKYRRSQRFQGRGIVPSTSSSDDESPPAKQHAPKTPIRSSTSVAPTTPSTPHDTFERSGKLTLKLSGPASRMSEAVQAPPRTPPSVNRRSGSAGRVGKDAAGSVALDSATTGERLLREGLLLQDLLESSFDDGKADENLLGSGPKLLGCDLETYLLKLYLGEEEVREGSDSVDSGIDQAPMTTPPPQNQDQDQDQKKSSNLSAGGDAHTNHQVWPARSSLFASPSRGHQCLAMRTGSINPDEVDLLEDNDC